VRSYRTFSPLLVSEEASGLFSVALSLGSPPPDVIRHRMSMEPGLSSPAAFRPLRERPSGRLTRRGMSVSGAGVKRAGPGMDVPMPNNVSDFLSIARYANRLTPPIVMAGPRCNACRNGHSLL